MIAAPLSLALTLAVSADPRPAPEEPTLVERFVVEEPTDDGPRPVAVVAWRRVPTEAGLLLEQEVIFRAGGLRVLIAEQHEPGERPPRLVWRELRTAPTVGRTWLAEWDEAQAVLATATHGTGGPVHGVLAGDEPTWPLALIEALRRGAAPARVDTLDPLGRCRVVLDVTTVEDGERRSVELRRSDGSLAGRYVFDGDALIEFAWQAGDRVARPCDAREYDGFAARWRVHFDPLGDLRSAVRAGLIRPR